MNLPDNCPFCGAGVSAKGDGSKRSEWWVSFDCFTQVFVCDPHPTQSESCKSAERARLAARVAELEARCRRMQEIGDMIVDEYMVEKAEKDAWQQAKEAKP